MNGPTADQASVLRYGEERATEFARIKAAQSQLIGAFDALASTYAEHSAAAEAAWAFDYLWSLLDERRETTLALSAGNEVTE